MEWRVEEIPELRGYTIEWAEDRDYILSKRNRLFRSTSLQKPLAGHSSANGVSALGMQQTIFCRKIFKADEESWAV